MSDALLRGERRQAMRKVAIAAVALTLLSACKETKKPAGNVHRITESETHCLREDLPQQTIKGSKVREMTKDETECLEMERARSGEK